MSDRFEDEPANLYPTFPTVEEAITHIKTQLPITSYNELVSVLMTYRNTLLYVERTGLRRDWH